MRLFGFDLQYVNVCVCSPIFTKCVDRNLPSSANDIYTNTENTHIWVFCVLGRSGKGRFLSRVAAGGRLTVTVMSSSSSPASSCDTVSTIEMFGDNHTVETSAYTPSLPPNTNTHTTHTLTHMPATGNCGRAFAFNATIHTRITTTTSLIR